jgi:hypothetical protein
VYRESIKEPLIFGANDYVKTPVGIAHYSYPDSFPARKYVERGYNVQYWKDMPKGEHRTKTKRDTTKKDTAKKIRAEEYREDSRCLFLGVFFVNKLLSAVHEVRLVSFRV